VSNTNNVVALNDVNKYFGGVKAVLHVTTSVKYGERRLLIGTNGAGKTTLFNLITGDLPVSSGTIEIFGKDVKKMNVQKRAGLGMRRTYQTSALMDGLTVRQNLYLALLGTLPTRHHLNLFRSAAGNVRFNQKVEEMGEKMSLETRLEDLARDLSHGDRRQLELGTALITEPKLLLLDEPAAGLSAEERQNLVKVIRELPRDITIILVEHDLQMAFAVADSVTVMYDGEIVAEGTVEEIQNNTMVQEIYLGGKFDGHSNA